MGDYAAGQLQTHQPPFKRWQQTFKYWYNKIIFITPISFLLLTRRHILNREDNGSRWVNRSCFFNYVIRWRDKIIPVELTNSVLRPEVPFEARSFDLSGPETDNTALLLLKMFPQFDPILNLTLNGQNDGSFPNHNKVYLPLRPPIPLHNINIAHLLIKPAPQRSHTRNLPKLLL